jgi:hypothetical protein
LALLRATLPMIRIRHCPVLKQFNQGHNSAPFFTIRQRGSFPLHMKSWITCLEVLSRTWIARRYTSSASTKRPPLEAPRQGYCRYCRATDHRAVLSLQNAVARRYTCSASTERPAPRSRAATSSPEVRLQDCYQHCPRPHQSADEDESNKNRQISSRPI